MKVVSDIDREAELGIVEAIHDSLDFIQQDVAALKYSNDEFKKLITNATEVIRELLIKQYAEDYEV